MIYIMLIRLLVEPWYCGLDFFLQEKWPAVFSSLTDYPLNKKEKNILEKFLKKIENLNKKIGYKITFFNDFQKYMKESIEK